MKLSVLANLYGSKPLDEALAKITSLGVHSVEIGAGGYPGKDHCNPAELLADEKKLEAFKATFKKYDVEICALACHGNPIHPNKAIAKQFHDDMVNAILLAEKIGVDTIVGFSGCPGSDPDAKRPSWITCPWPDDFLDTLKYQWEVMIAYWKDMTAFAKSHGVTKIALEMHPGFCVYNPETLLKLRAEVGDVIGANLDPSHLIWQGINPVIAARNLAGAIYHVHAKDTKIDDFNASANGVLDTKHYGDELNRAWIFRTVGYGHGEDYWRDFVSALRLVGYDKVLSIEHEDSLMTIDEGLEKAVRFLDGVMIKEEKPCGMRWA
ncbi:MAG: sugar phosphate isomerase/epimerase [Ruminococcaceae bacterium]|nr:sugar phosphate isomerase/epimerase [Oscillospiraceae bacterium]